MFFDDEDMKFNINIPEDTPPDGITNCSDFNDMLTGLVDLVANLDPTDALASLSLLESVPSLLYEDGPTFDEEKALGILIGQTFIVTIMIDSFDIDSQNRFFNTLEAGLKATEKIKNELGDAAILETEHFATENLIRIFRDCDFDDKTSRQLLMMKITNFASNEDSSINEIVHAQIMLQLNVTILSLLAGLDDDGRNDIIAHLQETATEIASDDWVPYYNTPSEIKEIGEESVDEAEPAKAAQRVTFSMCFDLATQDEAIAHFIRSATTVLESENLDVILKVETFDEPLDHPYVIEKPIETRFIDVDKNKELLRKVLQNDGNPDDVQEDQ